MLKSIVHAKNPLFHLWSTCCAQSHPARPRLLPALAASEAGAKRSWMYWRIMALNLGAMGRLVTRPSENLGFCDRYLYDLCVLWVCLSLSPSPSREHVYSWIILRSVFYIHANLAKCIKMYQKYCIWLAHSESRGRYPTTGRFGVWLHPRTIPFESSELNKKNIHQLNSSTRVLT